MLTLLGVRAYIKYITDKVRDLVYARTPGNLSATTSVHIKHCGLIIFGVRAVLSGRAPNENAAIALGMHRFWNLYIVVSFQIQNCDINVQTYKEPLVLEKTRH